MICTRFGFLDDRADDQLDRRLLKRESVFDASAINIQVCGRKKGEKMTVGYGVDKY